MHLPNAPLSATSSSSRPTTVSSSPTPATADGIADPDGADSPPPSAGADPGKTAAARSKGSASCVTIHHMRHLLRRRPIGGLPTSPTPRSTTAAEVLGSIVAPLARRLATAAPMGPRPADRRTPDGELWRGSPRPRSRRDRRGNRPRLAPRAHRGHAAVAVDAGDRWLLHAGDALPPGTSTPIQVPFAPHPRDDRRADLGRVRDNHATRRAPPASRTRPDHLRP
jgi:hypothetical protein